MCMSEAPEGAHGQHLHSFDSYVLSPWLCST